MNPRAKKSQHQVDNKVTLLQFPSNHNMVHGTLLFFKKYEYSNNRDVKNTKEIFVGSNNIKSSILLPLPDQLIDTNNINIGTFELGMSGAATAAGASKSAAGLEGLQDQLVNLLKDPEMLKTGAEALGSSFLKEALSSIDSGAQKGLEVGFGSTRNPFTALTFDGVGLKTFTFNWTLAPSDGAESNEIHQIVKNIRKNIHPKYGSAVDKLVTQAQNNNVNLSETTQSRIFLQYPSVCYPMIIGSRSLIFKPCMVSQFTVDYAGGGELAFHEFGDPAVVKISMTLQEMQIWTSEDYMQSENTAWDLGDTGSSATPYFVR